MKIDSVLSSLISDILVNLSAGWLALAIATPFSSERDIATKTVLLTVNLGFSIVLTSVAFRLRKSNNPK